MGLPDSELAAAMQQRHHVKQPLVITLQPVGRRRGPELLDKSLGARMRPGEAGDGVDRDQALRVALLPKAAVWVTGWVAMLGGVWTPRTGA